MRTAIIGYVLFLLTFSTLAGTFVETFDDGDLGEWQEMLLMGAKPGSWEIIDGELHAISRAGFTRLLTIGTDETWQDYVIEVDVKPLEKHGLGNIAIAARVEENWAVVSTIGDLPLPIPLPIRSCFVGNFDRKVFNILSSEAGPLLKLENWSTLKFRVNRNTFTFWLNGKQVLETTNQVAHLRTGGAGFGLANYTARFDNITITGDGIPDKGGLLVNPQAKLATTWGSLKRF